MSVKKDTYNDTQTDNITASGAFPAENDPFDQPLEDNLIMNDTLFEGK